MWFVGSDQLSWCAKKNPMEIIRLKNPLSCPSKKKTAQRDLTAETALKSSLRKCSEFPKKTTPLLGAPTNTTQNTL